MSNTFILFYISYGTNRSCPGQKSIISVRNDNKFSLHQDILRYKTKEVAQIVSDRREKMIKGDPEVYIQHKPSSDHERYSNIEVSVLEGTRKYAKQHSGDPARYLYHTHKITLKVLDLLRIREMVIMSIVLLII
jgi:hypothetical protein